MKSRSILQSRKECYISGRTGPLHKHHIYFGNGNRNVSDENGFWVWLAPEWHNMSNCGVHFNRELDLFLKMECQTRFEDSHSREEFMNLIGRNYLEDNGYV